MERHTQHRATLVLLPPALADIARDAEIDGRQVLNDVCFGVETTHNGEAPSFIHFGADGIELLAQEVKRERLARDFVAIEALLCSSPMSVSSEGLGSTASGTLEAC